MRSAVAGLVLAAVVCEPAMQLLGDGRFQPAWAGSWRDSLRLEKGRRPVRRLSLSDLNGLIPNGDRLSARGSRQSRPVHPEETGRLRLEILADCAAAEDRLRQAALADWQAHLQNMAEKKLTEARLAWEERFRDRAIELGQQNDQKVQEYAAQVRRAYFGQLSELEMRLTMTADPAARQELEMELAQVFKRIEAEVASYQREIAERCRHELAELQRQAERALASLEAALQAETADSLALFRALQQETSPEPAH
ncbi:MAG: hypothetical protein ACM3XS_06710 [Bacteroidota bacterium]